MTIAPWLQINPLDFLKAAESGTEAGMRQRQLGDEEQQFQERQGLEQEQLGASQKEAQQRIAAQATEDARNRAFQQQQLAVGSQDKQNALLTDAAESFLTNQRQAQASNDLLSAKLATTGLEEQRLQQPKVIAPGDSVFDPTTGKFQLGPSKPASPLPGIQAKLQNYDAENRNLTPIIKSLSVAPAGETPDQKARREAQFLDASSRFMDNVNAIRDLRSAFSTPAAGTSPAPVSPSGAQGPSIPVGTDIPGKGMFMGGGYLPDAATGAATSTSTAQPSRSDVSYLVAHPEVKEKFDARFGDGAADAILQSL